MADMDIRVLIVEDDEEQREGLAEWLRRREKITADTAATGEEALALIHEAGEKYDAVLMDEVLPGIDGIETMRRIKASFPSIPFIMFTGKAPEVGLEAYRQGAYVYILKPINNDEIAILLRHISETRQFPEEAYLDFNLYVGPGGYIQAHSDQGERVATISLDVPNEINLTVSLIEERKTNERLLKQFGMRLYDLIFPAPIHTHFTQTEAVAKSKNQKVRIRLVIEPDMLARLPWEFTYREEGGHHLAVNPQTALSRYLNLPVPPDCVGRRAVPLHMLTIIADPIDQPPLNPDQWDQLITNALAAPLKDGLITIKTVKHATFEEISNSLLKQKPDIVQFVGHGIYSNGKGYLALVDSKTDKTWPVDDVRFANLFLGADDHLGLVSLATCESAKSDSPKSFLGIAPQIVQRGVPAVVAMQYKVLISTAEIFLEHFYRAVATRKPVDWAVQWARKAVSIKMGLDNREFATPVLYMRAKDGNIF
jgi:CheY-like chemotaxis protein